MSEGWLDSSFPRHAMSSGAGCLSSPDVRTDELEPLFPLDGGDCGLQDARCGDDSPCQPAGDAGPAQEGRSTDRPLFNAQHFSPEAGAMDHDTLSALREPGAGSPLGLFDGGEHRFHSLPLDHAAAGGGEGEARVEHGNEDVMVAGAPGARSAPSAPCASLSAPLPQLVFLARFCVPERVLVSAA